jgi:hypothetical protein
MVGLDALGIWWGYAEGDPRLVGTVVVALAAAAAIFVGRRAAEALRASRESRARARRVTPQDRR